MGINRRLLRPVAALRRRLRHLPAMPGLRRRLAIAVGVALFLIVADYFAGNLSFPIFDSSADLGLQAFIKDFYDSDSDVDGRSISPTWWGGYVDSDGSLCRNMQFIPFPKSASESIGEMGEIRHRYLGHHVLGMNTPDELRQQLDGKVILIGNFDDDRHDTYIGDVPGTLIQYYAWKLLQRGGHKINWWLQIFLFVFYTLSVLAIISPCAVYRPQRLFMVIVKALVGWSLVFFILKSLIYWLTGQSFITLIPALTFTTLTLLTTISATRRAAPTPTPGTAPISERRSR